MGGPLPWHVVSAAVRPGDGYVYGLTEGAGRYGSPDDGSTWQSPQPGHGPSLCLLMHPGKRARLFGGRQKVGTLSGGVFASANGGKSFHAAGLLGVTIGGLAANGAGTRLYAAAYGSGIYVSPIPATA